MAVVVLSRPAQAWPIAYTPRAHVCKTLGGSFIRRHILSRQWQAAGRTGWRAVGVLVWQTKKEARWYVEARRLERTGELRDAPVA